MKINFITVSCHLTGGNRVIMEIINGLAARGHELTLVTLDDPAKLNWIKLKAKVVSVRRSLIGRLANGFYRGAYGFIPFPEDETRNILRILPHADANIATMSYTGYAASRAPSGVPFHYYLHYEPMVREEGYKRKIMEETYFLPTIKIANSSWLVRMMKEKAHQESAGLVLPAIDHAIFNAPEPRKHPGKSRPIRIVSLAKHKVWKGFPDALRAIQMVRDRGYDVEFIAFGGLIPADNLPDDVKKTTCTFAGSKSNHDLANFYRSSDILISTSFFESFPLPQLEAMACGTPVVTTPYGTEDYAIHEKNALIAKAKDPKTVADALVRLIDDAALYERLSKEGIETAKTFTWESATLAMEKILTSHVGRHP